MIKLLYRKLEEDILRQFKRNFREENIGKPKREVMYFLNSFSELRITRLHKEKYFCEWFKSITKEKSHT